MRPVPVSWRFTIYNWVTFCTSGNYQWFHFVFVKHIYYTSDRSWSARVRLVHSWAVFIPKLLWVMDYLPGPGFRLILRKAGALNGLPGWGRNCRRDSGRAEEPESWAWNKLSWKHGGIGGVSEFPRIDQNRKSCGNVRNWRKRDAVRRNSHGNLKKSFGMNLSEETPENPQKFNRNPYRRRIESIESAE